MTSLSRGQSLQPAQFEAEGRRRAWLRLLDLELLAPQLEASTSRTSGHEEPQLAPEAPLTPPLDGDGWQIPHAGMVGNSGAEADSHDSADEWVVASSKRQQRRRRGRARWSDDLQRRTSISDTTLSLPTTEATTPREQSRTRSTLGEDDGGAPSNVDEKEERRRRRREKRKRTEEEREQDDERGGGGDIDASGVLLPMPSSRDQSLEKDELHFGDLGKDSVHRDEAQVALDVARSFLTLEDERMKVLRREQLSRVIVGVLRQHPGLHYYQGYHDIISVLLTVLIPVPGNIADADAALQVVVAASSRLSLHLLRDNMTVNMEPSMGHLKVLRNLLRDVDSQVSVNVESASALPYFALPWLISLFAHEVDEKVATLVFDHVLSRGPPSVLYIAVALILNGRDDADDVDAAEKHHALSQLPARMTLATLPAILESADSLANTYPLQPTTASVMGPRSVLVTWSQLPFSTADEEAWTRADALAEAVLDGGTENIVLDALPTPPASDDGSSDEHYKRGRARRGESGKRRQTAASLLAVVGAVGAVGVAALVMYGAGREIVPYG